MAKGVESSPEVRASVMAALLQGQGVNAVSREYNISASSVSRIKRELLPVQLAQIDTEKKNNLDTLLLEAVSENLRALKAIAKAVSDPAYIEKQPAESIGMLYGIMADKSVRFLEAAAMADEVESV